MDHVVVFCSQFGIKDMNEQVLVFSWFYGQEYNLSDQRRSSMSRLENWWKFFSPYWLGFWILTVLKDYMPFLMIKTTSKHIRCPFVNVQ
jgi:hypothetical protein